MKMIEQIPSFTVSVVTLVVACLAAAMVSFLVWVFPFFFMQEELLMESTVKPYKALELYGRDVYIAQGCSYCHSQMVRPIEEDILRYGPATQREDDIYDFTHLWGSKRTGPDLTNVGIKYSSQWHAYHLKNPQEVVARSTMPPYPFLFKKPLDPNTIVKRMKALRRLGVPYTDTEISQARLDVMDKTEGDAVVAYMQSLRPAPEKSED